MPRYADFAFRRGSTPRSPARQTRDKIREIEHLNPGKKVILAPIDPGPEAGAAA